eukprot:m.353337 g.353337  ORF g.353337 m.353337 type:complete len:53 (+) comp16740_c0_seq1:1693-1851(+)
MYVALGLMQVQPTINYITSATRKYKEASEMRHLSTTMFFTLQFAATCMRLSV